jgi:aldose 1-epimerase
MKQWPFAHTIDMTYRLQSGVLEVQTTITNQSAEAMPVSIGFHPYYQLSDSPRDEWTLGVGARTHWLLAQNKVPTGETEPIEKSSQPSGRVAARRRPRRRVRDLVRDGQGRATMSIVGRSQRLDLVLGANYRRW